ncbi:MAG: pro-sigmaK processing inhibitor BofA family protein [Clostridia bacterium]|nr:pro-sigmaK processing inhibitor BofA family protein [Clostridia bacterium]
MDYLFILLGITLCALFFLNMKSAANILCRIVGGFLFLIIYNTIAPMLSFPAVGINLVTASLCGILEIPGAILLIALTFLF